MIGLLIRATAFSSNVIRTIITTVVHAFTTLGASMAADRRSAGPRRLASLATAAAHADVSVRTLRRYIAQGRLAGYRVGPRLMKVDLNDVDRLARPIPTHPSVGPSPYAPRP